MTSREMIDRYVYAVIRRLPDAQRADIEQELRGLIEDMLEERTQGAEATAEHVERVLLELGNPSEFADRYRGNKRFLISPELFPAYWAVLRIVLIIIASLTVIKVAIDPQSFGSNPAGFLFSLADSLVQGFAWVTITFGLLEYAGVQPSMLMLDPTAQEWKPSMLADIPDPSSRIRRREPISSLIATVLFTVIFMAALAGLGVHPTDSGRLVLSHPVLDGLGISAGDDNAVTVISIFNIETVRDYAPFIYVGMALYIVRDILKLTIGRWTVRLAAVSIAVSVLWAILMVVMIGDSNLWNPHFAEEITRLDGGSNSEAIQTAIRLWENNKTSWLPIVGLIVLADAAYTIVKVYRARARKAL